MDIPPDMDFSNALERLRSAVISTNALRYASTAGLTIAIYDTILTFSDELYLIWPAQLSVVKVLYFINRYIPLLTLIFYYFVMTGSLAPGSDALCQYATVYAVAAYWVTMSTMTWTLTMRVVAIYERCRAVRVTLYTLFICFNMGSAVLLSTLLVYFKEHQHYNDILHMCMTFYIPPLYKYCWIMPTIYEAILGVLTCYKAAQNLFLFRQPAMGPLTHNVLRDGTLYALTIITIYIVGSLNSILLTNAMSFLTVWLHLGLASALVSRLQLNLKKQVIPDPIEIELQAMERLPSKTASMGSC